MVLKVGGEYSEELNNNFLRGVSLTNERDKTLKRICVKMKRSVPKGTYKSVQARFEDRRFADIGGGDREARCVHIALKVKFATRAFKTIGSFFAAAFGSRDSQYMQLPDARMIHEYFLNDFQGECNNKRVLGEEVKVAYKQALGIDIYLDKERRYFELIVSGKSIVRSIYRNVSRAKNKTVSFALSSTVLDKEKKLENVEMTWQRKKEFEEEVKEVKLLYEMSKKGIFEAWEDIKSGKTKHSRKHDEHLGNVGKEFAETVRDFTVVMKKCGEIASELQEKREACRYDVMRAYDSVVNKHQLEGEIKILRTIRADESKLKRWGWLNSEGEIADGVSLKLQMLEHKLQDLKNKQVDQKNKYEEAHEIFVEATDVCDFVIVPLLAQVAGEERNRKDELEEKIDQISSEIENLKKQEGAFNE